MSMPIPRHRESTRLRFPLGGRVECHIGADWKAGYVVAHFYVQDTFPQGTCVPYQVQLDDGRLIFARLDEDSTIRREPDPVSSVPWLDPVLPQPENRRAVLGSLRSALAGVLIAFVLLQLADYLTTGAVSGRVRFVSADLVDAGGWLTPDGLGVAACAAAFASMGVQAWAGPDGTEWLNRAGIYSRAGAPDRVAALMHAALIAVGHETLLRGALPTLSVALFPGNQNAVGAGLVLSIAGSFVIHPTRYAPFAAFAALFFCIAAGFTCPLPCLATAPHRPPWAICRPRPLLRTPERRLSRLAAYCGPRSPPPPAPRLRSCHLPPLGGAALYGGVVAAVLASFLAQLGATLLHFHRRDAAEEQKEEEEEEAPSKPPPPAPEPEPEPEAIHWGPLEPLLPRPEHRTAVLRALRSASMRVFVALVLYQASRAVRTGQPFALQGVLSLEAVDTPLTMGSPVNVVGIGLAAAAAVVLGLDNFSAAGRSGALHESAAEWLNGARHISFGFRDRVAVLSHALFTAAGHEALFRGALPSIARALLLQQFPKSEASVELGALASVVVYYCVHPSRYALFAAFAAVWLAIAAYCGGLAAALLASFLSQLGASSLYYHAKNKAQEGKKDKGKKDKGKKEATKVSTGSSKKNK